MRAQTTTVRSHMVVLALTLTGATLALLGIPGRVNAQGTPATEGGRSAVPALGRVTDEEASGSVVRPGADATFPHPGQLSTKFRINDDNPEASVPPDQMKNRNPLEFGYFIQDLLARAESAKTQKRYSELVRYDRALVLAVPDRAKSWSELCKAYKLINDRDKAMRSCKNATERGGAELDDFVGYVQLALMTPGPLSPDAASDLRAVVGHLEREGTAGIVVNHLRCEVGVKLHDLPMLEACTAALSKVAPEDLKTVVFQWNLAIEKGELTKAARLLDHAKDLGLPADNLARMMKFNPTGGGSARWILGTVVVLAAAASGAVWLARRRRSGISQPASF